MNILDQLAEYSRLRVAEDKKKISLEEMKNIAIQTKNERLCDFAFEKALKKDGLSFICECKKASPSKGLIEPDFRYLEIAREYEAAGADCISVLTEPKWFLGSDEYLREIAKMVSIPCIRKDFTVDEYQIYQAKTLGAAAVLLICSILSEVQLGEYIKICDSLGISALVEIKKCLLELFGRITGESAQVDITDVVIQHCIIRNKRQLDRTTNDIEFQRLFRSGTLHLQFEARAYLPAKHLANLLIILSCKVLAVDFHKNIACLQAYGSRRHMFIRFGYHGTLQFGIPGYDRADTAIRILQHLFQFALVVFRKILRIGVK